jgi:hypothetical protein
LSRNQMTKQAWVCDRWLIGSNLMQRQSIIMQKAPRSPASCERRL